MSFVE